MQTADARRCNLSTARCNDSSVTTTSHPNLIPFVFVLWVTSIDTRLISVVNYKQHSLFVCTAQSYKRVFKYKIIFTVFDVSGYILRFVYGEEFRADVGRKLCMMFNEALVAVVGWTESGECRRR